MILHHCFDGPAGAGAPVIILGSSLGTSLEMWEPQISHLVHEFRVVRYDRRGHGRSPVSATVTSIDELGRDILALLDDLEFEQVSFCGLSLGGLEGMWLAVNAPERIDRLVLCCTAPSFGDPAGWLDRAASVRVQGLASIADPVLDRWFSPSFRAEQPDVVARFRTMFLAASAEGYAACCEAIAGIDLAPRLQEIVAPTLVITGSEDPVVPPAAGDALAAAIAGSIHVVVDKAAHLASVEQPQRVADALLHHLTTSKEAA